MFINNEPSLKSRRLLSRPKLVGYFVLRSGTIGLISGSVLGGLFGLTLFAFIWTVPIGAGLGLGLGLVNGLGSAKEVRMHCSGELKTRSPQCDFLIFWRTKGSCALSVRRVAVTYS